MNVEAYLNSTFNGPLEEVAPRVSSYWRMHEDRKTAMPGTGHLFIAHAGSVNRYFRLEDAIGYSHQYTMDRWPHSRGPEIAGLRTADVIGYSFHQYVLPFIKVGDHGSAANVQLASLKETDSHGQFLPGEDKDVVIGGAKLSALIGLTHQGRAFLTPIDLHGNKALLLSIGASQLSPEELQLIEEDLLREV